MSATDPCGGSVQACFMRVAALGADGVPAPGASNLYVSDALVKLSFTPELKAGSDFELISGCGAVCVQYKDCDRIKRLTFDLEICSPDPELTQMLVGGALLTQDSITRGFAFPAAGQETCPNGVSIEAWSKNIDGSGNQDADWPWWRWVFPRTFWQLGARELANSIMTNPLTGFGTENDNFYNGPANDIPADFLAYSNRVGFYFTDHSVPVASCGAQALSAS